jgi:sugar transferase (PEP-CTERM system associated)
VVLVICAYLGFKLHNFANNGRWSGVESDILGYSLTFAAIMLLSTYAMGVYHAGVAEGFGNMLVRTVVSYCLLGAASMVTLYSLVSTLGIGRGSLFTAVMLSLFFVLLVRWIFYSVVDSEQLRRRILVLGAGHKAMAILECLKREPCVGSEIVGFVPAGEEHSLIDAEHILNPAGSIKRLVDQHAINEIVVAVDERRREKGSYFPLEDLLDCKMTGTKITELIEFYEREFYRIDLEEINTSWMVFSDQFRYSLIRDKTKRLFDLSVCVLLLAVAWPFMLLTAVAVFLESGWPIIYRQQRVGYKGRLFDIYKFRSMTQDAERDGKAVWAQKNDARITKVGVFIRNTRLDELPQLLNVFRGEMSFVGPRPERPEFVNELTKELPFYDARHRVKPGLMGWAQLKYSYGASFDDAANKLVYDLYYVKNHSLLLDALIVVQSVEIILLGKGAR